MKRQTPDAPLAARGDFVPPRESFAPLREPVQLGCKTGLHKPHANPRDVVVGLRADCAALKQLNTRLRPDTALAAAWGRERFADQATTTRGLDAFRGGSPAADCCRAPLHPGGAGAAPPFCPGAVVLGHRPDGVTRRPSGCSEHHGLLQRGDNRRGRQLARGSAPQSHAGLVSLLSPGNQTGQACLRPTVATVGRVLGLTPAQRRHTVRRLDGGFGPDANCNWALWPGDQVLGQGYRGKRAKAFARAGPRWEARCPGARLRAPDPTPRRYDRRPQTAVLKWKTDKGPYGPRLFPTSLLEPSLGELAEAYDDRAAIAAESKAERGGLPVHRRRKQRLATQEALVLLPDLAHNLLAWTRDWLFHDSPCADAGIDRMGKEFFPIPGTVMVEEGQIVKLRLKTSHPLAQPMLAWLTGL